LYQFTPGGGLDIGYNIAGSRNSANPNGLNLGTSYSESINSQKSRNGDVSSQNAGTVGVSAALNLPVYHNAEALANKYNNRRPRT
jgi:hypothetical protein